MINSVTQIFASNLISKEVELVATRKELRGYCEAFTQGQWDGCTGGQPNPDLWRTSSSYRQGFQSGQAEYFDKKFGVAA